MSENQQHPESFRDSKVRVRFAPSPTGALHIGGARTAYFNWLFARKHGGTFVLRIDDTDKARSTQASYEQILNSFQWLGLDWDEGPNVGGAYGPYRQSERSGVYRRELQALIERGKVYPCFCSAEQLQEERDIAVKEGRTPRYSGRCRGLSDTEVKQRIATGERYVYRLKTDADGEVVVRDMIRGNVSFAASEVDDFIVWKADDSPTYHFASCVDDASMEISHIIRAEEHLSNTPRHIALFEALEHEAPAFAHVPMILAPDRSKLSKRHGATSVQEYRDGGILPEALVNYLLLLGFSPGDDNEVISRETAVELFDLSHVKKHAAVYDVKKLEWLNAQYVRQKPVDELLFEIWPQLQQRAWVSQDESPERAAWIRTITQAVMQRGRSLEDVVDNMAYYFDNVSDYDAKGVKKYFADSDAALRLERAAQSLDGLTPFIGATIEGHYRNLIAQWHIKGGQLIHPTRLALTGLTVGPGLFDIMALLGRVQCQKRMSQAAEFIRKQSQRP